MYHPSKFGQHEAPYTFMSLQISASPSSLPSPSLPPNFFFILPFALCSFRPFPSSNFLSIPWQSTTLPAHPPPHLLYHFIPAYYFSASIHIHTTYYDIWRNMVWSMWHIDILQDAVFRDWTIGHDIAVNSFIVPKGGWTTHWVKDDVLYYLPFKIMHFFNDVHESHHSRFIKFNDEWSRCRGLYEVAGAIVALYVH